jgi:hypothetical protein
MMPMNVQPQPTVELEPQPPGLKHRFHAMVKPIGSLCNLNCTYCYYLHKEGLLHQPKAPRMAEPFAPFTFSPAGAAVYQLGPFGTAAKKLKQLDLKP